MTPVSSSASPAAAKPSASAPRKSTPAKPFTWRSTKPGAAMPRPFGPLEADGLDPVAVERDVARDEAAVDERRLDAEPHVPIAFRTTPSAASSRSRAVVTSIPARGQTIATFASPSARRARRRRLPSGAPVASETIRRTRARSLSFVATTSTIRLPKVLPSRIIAMVEIVLSTSFCAVPALSRVEPAMTSGPTTDDDLVVGERAELRAVDARDGDGRRLRGACLLEGAEHVRRASARAQADDGVVAAAGRSARTSRAPARGVVLGVLLGADVAHVARDERDDAARPDPEGRLASPSRRRARGARTCPRRRRRGDHRAPAARRSRRSRRRARDGLARRRRAPCESASFISVTSSSVVRRSRSAPAGFHASVARAVEVRGLVARDSICASLGTPE